MSAGGRQPDAGERVGEMEIGTQDGLKRRHVAEIQRARIIAAICEVCGERGAANVTVADVVSHAGVSRRTFYELFEDCEGCLLCALEHALASMSERVLKAYDPSRPWRERIRAALTVLLAFLEEKPAIGRLLVVESHAGGRRAEQLRARVLAHAFAAVDAGREAGKRDPGLPALIAEGTVGAVLFVIHRRIADTREPVGAKESANVKAPTLLALVNPLMSMIVLPYLGAAAARVELEREVVAPNPGPRPRRDSLTDLEIRLTYRTMRVLAAIGAQGGRGSYPSNREIGRAADAADPGQISKLLTRLQRIGLIENKSAGAPKGSPNAWKLTRKGAEVERAIAAHSGPLGG